MPLIFDANMSPQYVFSSPLILQCLADFLSTCPMFSINSHNVQFYCIKSKWHDRRHLLFVICRTQPTLILKLLLNFKTVFGWVYSDLSTPRKSILTSPSRILYFFRTNLKTNISTICLFVSLLFRQEISHNYCVYLRMFLYRQRLEHFC